MQRTATVPHVAGRVVGPDGGVVRGRYVTGWIKRGPTGVIGTNKGDAAETVASLLADLPDLPAPPLPERSAVLQRLVSRGARPVDWPAWQRLDAHELALGAARGTERVKVHDLAGMIAVTHPG